MCETSGLSAVAKFATFWSLLAQYTNIQRCFQTTTYEIKGFETRLTVHKSRVLYIFVSIIRRAVGTDGFELEKDFNHSSLWLNASQSMSVEL